MSVININRQLITNRGLNPNNISCNDASIGNDNTSFKNQLIVTIAGGNAMLPMNPGFEIHPYKGQLAFIDQSKVIIGTFPPISYLIDIIKEQNPGILLKTLSQPTAPNQRNTEPNIPFFHGNISALWGVLLTPTQLGLLNAQLAISRQAAKTWLIDFLTTQKIYYDDIILSAQRKLGIVDQNLGNLGYTYEDKNLKNICLDNDLIIKTITNPELEIVCFTNGATFGVNGLQLFTQLTRAGLVKTQNTDALSLFLRGCQNLGLEIEMQCLPHYNWTSIINLTQAQLSTKLIFELRLIKEKKRIYPQLANFIKKEFTVITPFSPAAVRFIGNHPIVINYQLINGNVPPLNILKDIYAKFRNNQHAKLYTYNV